MKYYKILAAMMFVVAVCFAVTASARGNKAKTVYVFGIGTSFNDSTAYFTPIQRLDSVETYGKTSLLANKQEYSYQLKGYFDGIGVQHETCTVVNADNRAKLEKSYLKLKQKYAKKWNFSIKNLADTDFKFERVVMAH